LPGAINIDWLADGFLEQAKAALNPARPVMVYCRTGKRSAEASKSLSAAGFQVRNLLGGYAGWTEFELPVLTAEDDAVEAEYATTLLAPGTPAPEFCLNDLEGNPVNISDFRGRSVVLVFWASWCPDCRAEVPDLKQMAASADPSEVCFVSVSFDREFEALQKFAAEQELPGVQLFEPAGKADSAVGAAYGVRWIPSLYLIDADGKVVFGTVLASKIAAALGAYPPRLLALSLLPQSPAVPAGSDVGSSSSAAASSSGSTSSASGATRQPCEDDSCVL
jgi:peroxiredoxin